MYLEENASERVALKLADAACRCRYSLEGADLDRFLGGVRHFSRAFSRSATSVAPSSRARRYQDKAASKSPRAPRRTGRFRKTGSKVSAKPDRSLGFSRIGGALVKEACRDDIARPEERVAALQNCSDLWAEKPCSTDGFGGGGVATIDVPSGGGDETTGAVVVLGAGPPGGAVKRGGPEVRFAWNSGAVGADAAVGPAGAAPCITPAAGGLTAGPPLDDAPSRASA